MKKRSLRIGAVLAVLVLVLAGGVLASDPGEPQPGTVVGLGGPHIFQQGSAITTTAYTASPKTVFGQDVSLMWLYHSADVFVTADVSGTDTITVTPQFSADASNWTNATYTYLADTLASTTSTSVITSTGLTTATTTTSTSSSTTPTEQTYRIVMSSDTTDYLRVAMTGKYLRFKIETSGTVTPTIKVLFRND